jgi:hypothetical protein
MSHSRPRRWRCCVACIRVMCHCICAIGVLQVAAACCCDDQLHPLLIGSCTTAWHAQVRMALLAYLLDSCCFNSCMVTLY